MTPRRFGLLVVIAVVLLMFLGAAGVYLLVGRATAPSPTPHVDDLQPAVTPMGTETVAGLLARPTTTATRSVQDGSASPAASITASSGLPTLSPTAGSPTSTATSTPPPALCSQLDLSFLSATSTVTRWRLENRSGQAMVIARIETTWPESNDAIFNAFLDGKVIWSGEELVSPTILTTWFGEQEDRQLLGVMSLDFFFGTQAAASGYDLKVRFSNGCEVAAAR